MCIWFAGYVGKLEFYNLFVIIKVVLLCFVCGGGANLIKNVLTFMNLLFYKSF